jgi:dipeptidyl aminopeptidase/acylaminoacyl peptidase
MRYRGITWGNNKIALVNEGLQGKQLTRTNIYNPSTGSLEKLIERNTTDAYSNPGFPVTEKNQWGRQVIKTIENGSKLLMNNTTGASPKGDLPFFATFDIATKKQEIIWRSDEGYYEAIVKVLDADKLSVLTRRESEKEVPNYYIRDLKNKATKPVTSFTDPYPQLQGVTKEKIRYKRADGVDLTGDLYLPKGYDSKRDGKLPLLLWAYPAEYNSAADAAQVRGSEHRFTLINWASPVFWVTQGYAVLNNAEMPIVSVDKDKKPNDNFIEQLKMNAESAINKLDEMGVGDRKRVAVGGHSYGAFMTANLLAHTNLFKAGIARSGAYNRSLTPFGFQNEDRTYWDDPKLYNDISAEVLSTDFATIVEEGKKLAAIHKNIVVKVPMIKDGVKAIKWFTDNGIRTNCTLVFSAGQAILCAKAGAAYVSPFNGCLSNPKIDSKGQVQTSAPNSAARTI